MVPVISPFPFSVNQAANTGSELFLPRGCTTVTPVRTGPVPTTSLPLPEIERGMAHFDAGHVGDRVERPGRAADRKLEVVFARFLRMQRTRKRKDADNSQECT